MKTSDWAGYVYTCCENTCLHVVIIRDHNKASLSYPGRHEGFCSCAATQLSRDWHPFKSQIGKAIASSLYLKLCQYQGPFVLVNSALCMALHQCFGRL